MNLANKLTISRIVLVPVFLFFLVPTSFGLPQEPYPVCRVLALLLFIGATITDYYDGVLARRHGWITNFGQLFDPLADKLIVMTAFVGMIEIEIFPSWMVALILAREFLITGLRTLAIRQGKVLAADRWGKNKTISQMATVITALVFLAVRDVLLTTGHWQDFFVRRWNIEAVLTFILQFMLFICVVVTVYSGFKYMLGNWELIRKDLE